MPVKSDVSPPQLDVDKAAQAIERILIAVETDSLEPLDAARAIENVYYQQDPWSLLPQATVTRLERWIVQAWKESPYDTQRQLVRIMHPLDMPQARMLLETECLVADVNDQTFLRSVLQQPREDVYLWLWMSLKRIHGRVISYMQDTGGHPFLPFVALNIAEMRDSFEYSPAPPPVWRHCRYPNLSERQKITDKLERLVSFDSDFAESDLGRSILATIEQYLNIPDNPRGLPYPD